MLVDLERIVADKINDSICGSEIDIQENDVFLEEMIGVVDVSESVGDVDIEGSIISPEHSFWDDYNADVESCEDTRLEIEKSIRGLKKKGVLEMPYLYDDSDVVEPSINYDEFSYDSRCDYVMVDCIECDSSARGVVEYLPHGKTYKERLSVDCNSCGESGTFMSVFTRWK